MAVLSRLHESHVLPPNSTSTRLFSRLAVCRANSMLAIASARGSKLRVVPPNDSLGEPAPPAATPSPARASDRATEASAVDDASLARSPRDVFGSSFALFPRIQGVEPAT